ncbi:hypothetical protein EYZ11_000634 [Aspergillus tanneri]|uniref:Uncharacterized protein n=1 Tax=Aspergillus tanneri TaxID=1220188 RepID=A0A4S3JWR0_9EURO|nr:uncharacterized protein ATNIH1004_007699 [Aspergillus tanneri]KAA8646272.1 hypothetical protein ATNIH1004_007699 [Aspergillus tanneri]THC99936.1 hypothetical protein EYZ11_000634 [Aspergillus tanneri]
MAWYSILPPDLIYVESWAARTFILLGLITIVPWALLIMFDLCLYLWRMLEYEIAVVGGRARGRQRPRAPSLNERRGRQRRVFSLTGYEDADATTRRETTEDQLRRRTPTDPSQ